MIPVYKPYFPKGALRYAHDAISSTWVSSKGKYLNKVKEKLAEIWGTEYIILTNSGTAANHLMARTLKKKYIERRNLIVPNNVFVAAWNPFIMEGYELCPIDAFKETWNIDYEKLGEEHWSKAILIVHNLGNIVNVPMLRRKYPNTPFIEDNCEGFGGKYEGKPSGTASDMFTVSFFGNKNLTSGEGGAFVTYDEELYSEAYKFWGQGMKEGAKIRFIHDDIGHNYRMTNVEAAILYGQLELMNEILEKKRILFDRYTSKFISYMKDLVYFPLPSPGTKSSNWMFAMGIKGSEYYIAKKFLDSWGIETRPMFYPITAHGHLKNIKCNIEIAKILSKEGIILPSYPSLHKEGQDYIIGKVLEYVRELTLL